jgi:predicted amidohydrolase
MKIAAVQMVSGPSLQPNLQAAAALVSEAAAAGARLVALPEYFCLLGRRDTDKLEVAEAPGRGPIQQALAGWAREHGIWIIGGTLPIAATAGGAAAASGTAAAASDDAASDDAARAGASAGPAPAARALNRSVVVAPDGRFVAHYDKLHLFAFDNGRESYDEGRTLRAGEQPVAVQCGPLRVGLSICYDLRFPELYRALMQPPCDLLVVPAAFTHTTGQAHWEILLRARAVENQCYVLAAAQGGTHGNGRRTWGRSMIVDPWGEVLAMRDEGEGVVVADVDPARIESVRRQLPALAHRRL